MKNHTFLVVAMCSLLSACVASARAEPRRPFMELANMALGTAIDSNPVSDFRFGRLNVRFEETTLKDIVDSVGAGEIQHHGDAGASAYWLCYKVRSVTADRAQFVWFISDGEMGGSGHAITEVQASSDKRSENPDCSELQLEVHPTFALGLWLGSSSKILAIDGIPIPTESDGSIRLSYSGTTTRQGRRGPDEFDVSGLLEARIKGGVIDALRVFQLSTH